MIPKETVDKIIDESRIEEVISDFVALKKRGVNLLGNCPFHNEKTPSFTVSPAKGIYKCFGCGVSGNAVNFVMEHEQMSYPEALKYLAKKYNITVEEKEISPDEKLKINKRESLFLISQFAKEQFRKNLSETDEGKSVGLGYFKSRGISDEMIDKFGLGYSFEERNHFTKIALDKGYKKDLLLDSGLTSERNNKLFDRFFGRIIFPIHNLSGRTIGFGARILQSNKKSAKYLNSPETPIYHKSDVLYGLYLAKRAMIQNDNCFLVEGYTDVISLHQKGIENVVASSGTSLTKGQIKLIKRFTPNITVLYDGDEAGIKASFRGIDLILSEGMNVKVVTFPNGEDPDSFARSNTLVELEEYIEEKKQDFISFKASTLLKEAKNDPIKRAGLIKEVVQSISIIPDMIVRSVYTQDASKLLNIAEQTLVNELNKARRLNFEKEQKIKGNSNPTKFDSLSQNSITQDIEGKSLEKSNLPKDEQQKKLNQENNYNEAYLLRLLLKYGHYEISVNNSNQNDELNKDIMDAKKQHQITVAQMVIEDISHDEIEFKNSQHKSIWEVFKNKFYEGEIPTEKFFLRSNEANLVKQVINITEERHRLNNWKKHSIYVTTEQDKIKLAITVALNRLKLGRIKSEIKEVNEKLKSFTSSEEINDLLMHLSILNQAKLTLSLALGRNL
ncbi:MAG: DNA primase [Flavobacteriales bacterium]|nr:DNA primase [Flavobacteriales bacterium]|tara:strand:+ start:11573 stop:13591 length:2019 start_codon:yes stop_codon:yes gene_type:complete